MDIRDLDLSLKPTFTRATVGAAGGKWSAKATVPYQAPDETSGQITYQPNKKIKITASGNKTGGMLHFNKKFPGL
jgi:hypothetical protein|tara:strand:+ start:246 stop:470 length:225 start_codon:yes stop_codon:yes gene_type:complete